MRVCLGGGEETERQFSTAFPFIVTSPRRLSCPRSVFYNYYVCFFSAVCSSLRRDARGESRGRVSSRICIRAFIGIDLEQD